MAIPQLTPDGTKYDPKQPQLIGDCWITSTSYPNLVSYTTDPTKSAFVDQYIIDACGEINKMCNRYFNSQTIDQIFKNVVLNIRDYTTFVLDYGPLETVTNIWVEVVNSFAPIDLQFLQQLTREGIVKILPSFSVYAQTTLPMWALPTSTNVWIRYIAGYHPSSGDAYQIPNDIKRATALMVDYLFGLDSITPNLSSYRTQTYSETSAKANEDPILTRIESMLKPYKKYKIV